MQQISQQLLKKAVQETNHSVYALSAQIVQLEVVQGAVARLMERIDDIVHKGWDKDASMAFLSIAEIRDTVRLIDMGFLPLVKEMSKEIKDINIHADAAFDLLIRSKLEQSNQVNTN
ncbi:hypothetical protein MKZ17_17315 [Solibacillus sp. FSL R7-0682]|uniref:hypothetical protein n=1 Tax=Solibacillus sp. FSL R7-0682 TaxID=2921690 RepID=UPI0030F99950